MSYIPLFLSNARKKQGAMGPANSQKQGTFHVENRTRVKASEPQKIFT
jgi:hypothetical protein